jgi:hypothetical protein
MMVMTQPRFSMFPEVLHRREITEHRNLYSGEWRQKQLGGLSPPRGTGENILRPKSGSVGNIGVCTVDIRGQLHHIPTVG